ncbi:Sodium/hydrogen exchanger [Thalictrum thalictroides]|uniref:Sodium/hydrogen exchanger n=1 Tax=Thalictrum thalictroides TaxID=46969 RepID=A0A7J6W4V4_THATH|nr:Sodium/hydrogen exchanger [Thalictrum thalictroides]
MASIEEGSLPFRILREEGEVVENDPVVSILFFGLCLILGIVSKQLLHGSKVPYTVALLIIGVALGSLEYGTGPRLGKLGDGIRLWAKINPDLLLAGFLPALLFESSFSMDPHYIKKCMVQMFLLAGPGVLLSTFILGCAVKLAFPYDWNWKLSLLLGGLLSATDPVAVVALLKELGARKSLSTIIEGESLMNDGVAMVLYQLFLKMVLGQSFSAGAMVKYLMQASIGAVGIGLAFGVSSVFWLGFIFNDTVIEITLTLAVSYLAYFTAQDDADCSGILTVMALGMCYSVIAKRAFKGDGQQSLHHFWEMVAYIANTLIFILSGVIIAEGVLSSKNFFENHETVWGYLVLLYVFVQASRAIVVGLLYPCLRYFGYGLDWKEATIIAWSGLRGPVSLALALSVKCTSDSSPFLSQITGTLFVFFTGGIVFLTLILNGSTSQFILHCLHLDRLPEDNLSKTKRRILDITRNQMMNKALGIFGDLGDDEEFGPSDWPSVRSHLVCLDYLEGEQVYHNALPGSENKSDALNLENIRIRHLNGVQASYWDMLEEGRISSTTANIMMQSVDEAMDLVSHEALCDWNGLKAHVHFPSYYRFPQMKLCPEKLVTFFAVERLELGCHICSAFLRAHRNARRQLHDFLGDNEIAALVIDESEAEGEEARKFLEDVRVIFPQVLRVLKTRQITYSILKQLSDCVKSLEKVGLSEEKEMIQLHDALQTDLKKLLRKPPSVKLLESNDLLRGHPFFGALPAMVREPLECSTKELMELNRVTIYREGCNPNGIWLISKGLIKWTSTILRKKRYLHPIFSHGSSLGLYEVLIGKPYICDMITDTVVQCFFIESEKIHSLRSDPTVEDFLWQESVLVIAKLLLPQIFEKMSMHELRALLVERSTMKIYTREETIDIATHSVGFLLEGTIKSQKVEEDVITSPAVLLPLHRDSSFFNLGGSGAKGASFYHQGSEYLVERSARVIIFDVAALEGDGVLQKQSASWISHSGDPPSGQSGEHNALMTCPEHVFMRRRHDHNSDESDQRVNSLSAKALRLSIFGSMVKCTDKCTQSFPTISHAKASVSSKKTVAVVPAQSKEAVLSEANLKAPIDDNNDVILRIDSPSRLPLSQTSKNFV